MKKVPPSEKLSKEIEEVLSGGSRGKEDLLEVLIDKSVRIVMQKILGQEVTDYLGRDYYERNGESRRGCGRSWNPKRIESDTTTCSFRGVSLCSSKEESQVYPCNAKEN